MKTTKEEIVSRVVTLLNQGIKDDESVLSHLQNEFLLSDGKAEEYLELIKTGLYRASVLEAGNSYPKNNLYRNEIVQLAVKAGLRELGQEHLFGEYLRYYRPWWKFW